MLHRYANNEERRTVVRECKKIHFVAVALKRATRNGAQHEEARCMTDIV